MKTNDKYTDIFLASHKLFLSQGYEATTIRQISDKAGVSLGLTNHFFHSKQELAGLMLDMLFAFTARCCGRQDTGPDLLAHGMVCSRVGILYLAQGKYRRFYTECLRHDIYFSRLEENPDRSLYELAQTYKFPVDDDLFLFYGTYVPYNCEKTLVLSKEKSMFPTISQEDIPDYIAISKFEHFLETDILNTALDNAHNVARAVLSRMPAVVPDRFLMEFLS